MIAKPHPFHLRELKPPFWARGSHLQTLFGYLIPSGTLKASLQKERLRLSDGDEIVLEFFETPSSSMIFLFHGLFGDSSSNYMQRMACKLLERNQSFVLVNHRNSGPGLGLARRPYHSGCSPDIEAVLQWGKHRFRKKRHIAIGYSLSGNALLLLLSEKSRLQPDAGIAINPPINLDACSQLLLKGMNRIYDQRFVAAAKRDLKEKQNRGVADPQIQIPWNASLRDYDEIYLAPAAGFKNRAHYYSECSTFDKLDRIHTPTFIIHAMDDPFVRSSDLLEARLSSSVVTHFESFGGHLGYLHSTGLKFERWLEYALLQALDRLALSDGAQVLQSEPNR